MDAIDDLGKSGESLVAEWIVTKGGTVLAMRWHCTFGELDLIALNVAGDLIFIEVKTRSPRNIDADGILAVTRSKQRKLVRSAQIFLLQHPAHVQRNCRFDIALVGAHPSQTIAPLTKKHPRGFTRTIGLHKLTLVDYIINAFEVNY